MLDVAIRKADGSTDVDWAAVGVRTAPPLPVTPALSPILPDGLRRGSTISVVGSLSLLLAVLGAASADGAWCALVGFGQRMRVSAEAAGEYGIELRRLALVPAPGPGWTTAVGALLDALDIVVARPPARLARRRCQRASSCHASFQSVTNQVGLRSFPLFWLLLSPASRVPSMPSPFSDCSAPSTEANIRSTLHKPFLSVIC